MKQGNIFRDMDALFIDSGVKETLTTKSSPFDKLETSGPDYLTNTDLLETILGDRALAEALLQLGEANLWEMGKLSHGAMVRIPGMTKRKASLMQAVIELGRRRAMATPVDREMVVGSEDVARYLRNWIGDKKHEVFAVIFLNRANKVISIREISNGGMTGTVADPRIILKLALELNAVNLILSHNHPSGSITPSGADKGLTEKIKTAAKYFDITVLDHVIVADNNYYSFADEGLM